MKFGITIPRFVTPGGDAAIAVRLCRHRPRRRPGRRLTRSWVMDHFFQMPMHRARPTSRCSRGTRRSASSPAVTERIRLGTLVTGVTYRHPGLLAKTVTTLDVLSGGRALARHRRRPGTSASTRPRRAVPAAGRAVRAPGGDAADRPPDVDGRRRRRSRASTTSWRRRSDVPQPLPGRTRAIMIGGSGEQKTLRLVARYADACNLFARPGDEGIALLQHKLDVLRAHCETEGRAYESIEKTVTRSSCAPRVAPDGNATGSAARVP